ncbi:hypothetical protein ASPVEDRAFT_55065 [Aspergillus versicolor CBS 583.65]|uniref:Zn(2)-C6 fungal-type domain-containing protein n=1 Tax=Aspergillus versicolor CBS 583.65 TaxID=1036611 RepID=A0A1L9PU24_ASPVE|nr:uncharacterized protein ASPVEDRAFT_55065 [Aspergillus versicolor CBS 583.65]OJJ05028.1 hypothetical protein ASPVEDRAFT_55065 [Aspergillus versicolor CBS 583.65]
MSQKATPTTRRVSLAYVPCRSKHLRCDATTPVCARCRTEGLQCIYAKSRRGGRRTRNPTQPDSSTQLLQNSFSAQRPISNISVPAIAPCPPSSTDDDRSTSSTSISRNSNSNSDLSDSSLAEQFIARYYSFFHFAHPCVLPQWALKRRLASDGRPLQTLVAVLQYIGSVYAKSVLSTSLKAEAEQAVSALNGNGTFTGFDVQAVLLFSIAIHWANEPEKSMGLLDRAVAMALQLGMQSREYAHTNGENDPLLEECWRRTWWQIYMTDAHIAGSTSSYPFRTSGMEMSVDLPCDEDAYESDYDMREFLDDDERMFSSYAELVGLTRGLDLAFAARKGMTITNCPTICANADAAVTAWRSLLHPSKKEIVREDGTVDELLFKASMAIQTLRGCNSAQCQLHTAKVLRAIDQFDDLLTLPTNISTHTPFIICMISNLVIAHLAACRFHYSGQPLKLARERVRLSMGALKVLGEYWPMGQRTYKEVGIIAREILGLKQVTQGKPVVKSPGYVPPEPERAFEPGSEEMPDVSAFMDPPSFADIQLLDTNFDFCGLFDMNVPMAAV